MLKKRIVGVLIVKNGVVVQSINFSKYIPVGKPVVAIEYLNKWGIDEIVIINIDPDYNYNLQASAEIEKYSSRCQVPLTIGGGIKSIEDIDMLIKSGADKIIINTSAYLNENLLEDAAMKYGSQCIIVSIDIKELDHNKYQVMIKSGKQSIDLSPLEYSKKVEKIGAGELLIQSIEHDGSKTGFDNIIIEKIASSINIPVIACSGAGHPSDFYKILNYKHISAAAAANYFHFTEHSVIITKKYLKNMGLPVRLDTQSTYESHDFDSKGRISKLADDELENLRFTYVSEEII